MKTHLLVLSAFAFLAVGSAGAVTVVGGTAPSPDAVRRATPPTAAAAADESHSIRQGVVTALGDQRDRIQVNGSWLMVVNGTTRMFRQGRVATINDIAKGQTVRFTLAPGAAGARTTLGVVYVP